jgi:hypothetical protein
LPQSAQDKMGAHNPIPLPTNASHAKTGIVHAFLIPDDLT